MTAQTLVVDQDAVGILDAALIEDAWFQDFRVPANTEGLRRIERKGTVYLLSDRVRDDSGLLIVRIGPTGVFSGPSKPRTVFDRILRVALRHFNRNITLPIQWKPYHDGSLLSIYAEPFIRRSERRIYFDQAPDGSNNVFAFAITDGPAVLSQVPKDLKSYRSAIAEFQEAALTEAPVNGTSVGHYGILLSEPLGIQLANQTSLKDWYDGQLSPEQLRFVKQPNDGPIRLRGAAGTGKTQAMAVKCLWDTYADQNAAGDKTVAFLTHSSALAHEIIRGMFYAMDPSGRWSELRTGTGRPKLWIGTLYELAQEQLGYEKKGVKPLSLDGREGRELQRLLIQDALLSVAKDPRVALGVLQKCPDFAKRMTTPNLTPLLIDEIMNEFACMLDAENIRKGTVEADRYIRAGRESWQMLLPDSAHRELIIEIHDAYRMMLKNERLLSMDQMIADFGRYLSTHEWTQLRERDGFNLIFVDEYQYFTRIEAMTLQGLFKPRAEHLSRWPLIMSYDLKQSTSDGALGGGVDRFRNPGVVKWTPNLGPVG